MLKGSNSFKIVFTSLLKNFFSKGKEFTPLGSKCFPVRVDCFQKGHVEIV